MYDDMMMMMWREFCTKAKREKCESLAGG